MLGKENIWKLSLPLPYPCKTAFPSFMLPGPFNIEQMIAFPEKFSSKPQNKDSTEVTIEATPCNFRHMILGDICFPASNT
jgi:hypothetical protein